MSVEKIGKRIKEVRLTRSMSQESLAEKIGISTSYMGMIERGEKTPSLSTFINLINALECSADIILSDILKTGYVVKNSLLTEKIEKLDKKEQKQIYEVIDTMIKNFK